MPLGVLTRRAGALFALLLFGGWSPAHAEVTAYTTTNVNQRAGPGTDFQILVTAPARSRITVYGCLEDVTWCDMRFGNSRGWMSARYIQAYYQGTYYLLPQVASQLSIPTRAFNIYAYWNAHYRDQPFYGDIGRWSTRGRSSVDTAVFYDRLSPYGRWVNINGRTVWVPTDVNRDWRPYTDGRWVYTRNHGWMWVSNEPFGWATYHYGRWGYSKRVGWFWVPGQRWGPGWVAWRDSGDHVAWAPLPPDDDWRDGRGRDRDRNRDDDGFSFQVNLGTLPSYYWQVVPSQAFLSINLSGEIVRDDNQRRRVLDESRDAGTTRQSDRDEVVNTAIDVQSIERRTRQRVQPLEVEASQEASTSGAIEGDKVEVFVPPVDEKTESANPPKVATVEEVESESPTTGQAGNEPDTENMVAEEPQPAPIVTEEDTETAKPEPAAAEEPPPPPSDIPQAEAPPPAAAEEGGQQPEPGQEQTCPEGTVRQDGGTCAQLPAEEAPPPAAEEPPPPPPAAEEPPAPPPVAEEPSPPPCPEGTVLAEDGSCVAP